MHKLFYDLLSIANIILINKFFNNFVSFFAGFICDLTFF
jgi:hypothetical protein